MVCVVNWILADPGTWTRVPLYSTGDTVNDTNLQADTQVSLGNLSQEGYRGKMGNA